MTATVLILGGTRESRDLCSSLADHDLHLIYSIAGETTSPWRPSRGELRIGGFGGNEGLSHYLANREINYVIDATHSFAVHMSRNMQLACAGLQLPYLRLLRDPWLEPKDQPWTNAETLAEAADLIPPGRRILLAIGKKHLTAFAHRTDCWFLMRSIERPEDDVLPLPTGQFLKSWPATNPTDELHLLRKHNIDTVISKNSGGSGAYAKIEAAQTLGLSIIMIRRPILPNCDKARDPEEARMWLDRQVQDADLGAMKNYR